MNRVRRRTEGKEMVDRNKRNNGISQLPDLLISESILCHLSTKDAVRTSVLSTKWRNLWKWVPGLDLDSRAFSTLDAFVHFGDTFFDSHRESWILKLKLSIHDSDGTKHLRSWIDAVTKRRIQQLDLCSDDTLCPIIEIPLSVFTCQTLVQLRLCSVFLDNPEFVSLPCLNIMYLEWVRCNNETTMEKLISGCPVLEDLTIIKCFYRKGHVIQVRSQALNRIHVDEFTEVVIDAPRLKSLKTEISLRKNFKIVTSGVLAKVDIDITRDKCDLFHMIRYLVQDLLTNCINYGSELRDILADISNVRDLVIGSGMWKDIFQYSNLKPLLHFRYLSRLTARFSKYDLEMFPALLESCPKLESLILELVEKQRLPLSPRMEPNMMFSTVPRCLVSSLKFVELKRSNSEYEGEMELIRYFLKNSAILEKLRLDNYYTGVLKELLAMPRCSITCEILVP